jgi:hypothetical protein
VGDVAIGIRRCCRGEACGTKFAMTERRLVNRTSITF